MSKVALMMFFFVSICGIAIAAPDAKSNSCNAPKYKIAKVDAHTDHSEALAISIQPKDVTIKNLFSLACQIRADYPTQSEVGADIFNDERAAKYTPVYGIEYPKNSNEAAYLASYYLNRGKGVETLTLAVNQDNPCGHNIQVDLRTNTVSIVSCK